MKTFHFVYIYDLNERTKLINKDSPMVKLFTTLSRCGEHGAWSKVNNHDLSFDI